MGNSIQTKNENVQEHEDAFNEVKRLRKLGKFDKALEIAEKYPLDPFIQSQRIKIYSKTKKYNKAKEIGDKFKDDALIQSQNGNNSYTRRRHKKSKRDR